MKAMRVTGAAVVVATALVMATPVAGAGTRSTGTTFKPGAAAGPALDPAQSTGECPVIFPDGPVVVAPNQPPVQLQSTVGMINALCDVKLDFVGCGFAPSSITLNCDSNGDGVPELMIPLTNIELINRLLVQATLPSLVTTPGTAFPLACCGGNATITLSRTVGAGDDSAFGPFTLSLTCQIDLGIRAPVVMSTTPVEGDCALGQNLLIPGACFLLADGKPNVTSVFAVEVGNPSNVIQAGPIQIITRNLLDVFFKPGEANAGKSFLIFVSGPNGTSRNLTALPAGAPAGCPLGNEQGIPITFKCKTGSSSAGSGDGSTASTATITGCRVERDDAGSFRLSIFGKRIRGDATLTVGGVTPKKIKFRDVDPADGTFTRIIAKKKFCNLLPGAIVIKNPDGSSSAPMVCEERCLSQ